MRKNSLSDIASIEKNLASKLGVIRRTRGLVEAKVAQVLGVSIGEYAQYEAGEVSLSAAQVFLLAKFFRVPVHVFFLPEDFDIALVQDEKVASQ